MPDAFNTIETGETSEIYIKSKTGKKYEWPGSGIVSIGVKTDNFQQGLYISQLYVSSNGDMATVEVENTTEKELKFRLTLVYLRTSADQSENKTIKFKEVESHSLV